MVAIIVHGGAWDIPLSEHGLHEKGVSEAARKGYALLRNGAGALDAVEEAVRCMEASSVFDAGSGSVLNSDGEIEMDAAIMDGSDLGFGAVAAIKEVAHPISVARGIMEKSRHCVICGEGALRFARSIGSEMRDSRPTERELERLRRIRGIEGYHQRDAFTDGPKGTVGAVAIDRDGHIAAGTSTGGTPGKLPGRVGDTPLCGCGTYADDASAGVSATGFGESLMKVAIARRVCEGIERGLAAKDATGLALRTLSERVQGLGGVIVIDSRGGLCFAFNTPYMAVSSIGHDAAQTVSMGR
jgi:beta-aspartyl-peptidase (threonine type)